VPAGGDVYILSRVLHNWPDEDCRTLLSNCRTAMATGGRLLIFEHLLPDEDPGAQAVALDINMMALFNGRERTGAELGVLLADTGFELLDRHALHNDTTMLTARSH
jgi:hypothetical protein